MSVTRVPDDLRWRVAAIADLRAIAAPTGSLAPTIQVSGYYEPGDGGGGPLRVWKTGAPGTYTDNGGSVIVPTGGDGSGAWVFANNIKHYSLSDFGYNFNTHTPGAEVILQTIFDFILTLDEENHINIFIDSGVKVKGKCTLRRGNVRVYGDENPIIIELASETGGTPNLRWFETLLVAPRNKNITIESLCLVGDFSSSLEVFYTNRATEVAARMYISGGVNVKVRNISANRVNIPVDVRNSTGVVVDNITMIEGGTGVSVISCSNVNVSNVVAVEYLGSAVDFAFVDIGVINNVSGTVSLVGLGYSEELIDMGSSTNIAVSNVVMDGPSDNCLRIKFEDVDEPFYNISVSNLASVGHAMGAIVIQPSANTTGILTENISLRGIRIISDVSNASGIVFTGQTPVYNFILSDFYIKTPRRPIGLPGVSNISVSNGYVETSDSADTNYPVTLGSRLSPSVPANDVVITDVKVVAKTTGIGAVSIRDANNVFIDGLWITESNRDGLFLTGCTNVVVKSSKIDKCGRNAILATIDTPSGFVDFHISNNTFKNYGYIAASRAAVNLVCTNDYSGVVISNNFALIDDTAPVHTRFFVLGSSVLEPLIKSAITENSCVGVDTLVSGDAISTGVLQRNNESLPIS